MEHLRNFPSHKSDSNGNPLSVTSGGPVLGPSGWLAIAALAIMFIFGGIIVYHGMWG